MPLFYSAKQRSHPPSLYLAYLDLGSQFGALSSLDNPSHEQVEKKEKELVKHLLCPNICSVPTRSQRVREINYYRYRPAITYYPSEGRDSGVSGREQ